MDGVFSGGAPRRSFIDEAGIGRVPLVHADSELWAEQIVGRRRAKQRYNNDQRTRGIVGEMINEGNSKMILKMALLALATAALTAVGIETIEYFSE